MNVIETHDTLDVLELNYQKLLAIRYNDFNNYHPLLELYTHIILSYGSTLCINFVTDIRVNSNKDNILRDDSVSPTGKLLHNGDICNCSSSMDDDISLQSSSNNKRTKDQSIQTEFDIFLDKDKENDEVGFFRFDNREFGARCTVFLVDYN